MSHRLKISREHARLFALRATGMEGKFGDLSEALNHLGYVQLDPLNVCGRMQDLILRNRLRSYSPGALLRHVHGDGLEKRSGFEHYIPGLGILVAWTKDAYPFIRAYLERSPAQGSRRTFTVSERKLGDWILEELRQRGPLRSDEIEHDERGATVWGTPGRLVKVVLEKLFACGEVLIRTRKDFRRVYDLAERVLPSPRQASLPSAEEFNRWRILTRLKQRRLVGLRRVDAAFLRDELVEVEIEDVGSVYSLRSDLALLEASKGGEISEEVKLLAPLDPVIYDRKLTTKLWDFDFTWEVYTPQHLRKRGYYSLPALRGLELVGDVEPRVDWKGEKLSVLSRRIRRGISTREAVRELGLFLGVRAPRHG